MHSVFRIRSICIWVAVVFVYGFLELPLSRADNSDGVSNESLTVNCSNQDLQVDQFLSRFETTKNFKKIWIYNCAVPTTSYNTSLAKLNINLAALEALQLDVESTVSTNVTLSSSHFEGLTIKNLSIRHNSNTNYTYANLSAEFDKPLVELRALKLDGLEIVPTNTSVSIAECPQLRRFHIERCVINNIPNSWLSRCRQLHTLQLDRVPRLSSEVLSSFLQSALPLRDLTITRSNIEEIDKELATLNNLQRLDLSHNKLGFDILRKSKLPLLTELNLSSNMVWNTALIVDTLNEKPSLEIVDLSNNPFFDICIVETYTTFADDDQYSSITHLPLVGQTIIFKRIRRLSLKSTITTYLCFGALIVDRLEYFDLSDCKITAVDFGGLPQSKAQNFTVNLSGNPVERLPLTKSQLGKLRQNITILGLNITLSCDCEQDVWLARAMREKNLVLDGVRCHDGSELARTAPARLECNKFPCAFGACTCRRAWLDNATEASCHGTLRTVPRLLNLSALHAADNLIDTLNATEFPDTLLLLDLRRNHLSRVDETSAAALFSVPKRRVWLAGNPLVCDCDNQPFLALLQTHRSQILDYDKIMCVNDGSLLLSVVIKELCDLRTIPVGLITGLVTVIILVSVAALIAGLYYRYGKQLKIYLFARGCCLCCVNEAELDADRRYDAFVSFSHKDETFVMEELLPGLEQEPYNFKLNVHLRDWVAGEMIPTQISRSVDQSRRTIIVLSRNFIQSVWGMLEFRTAHINALREGRARVVIVVLDDVVDGGGLGDELRGYLRTNTYVRWGDPWFWDKLRNALPRGPSEARAEPNLKQSMCTQGGETSGSTIISDVTKEDSETRL